MPLDRLDLSFTITVADERPRGAEIPPQGYELEYEDRAERYVRYHPADSLEVDSLIGSTTCRLVAHGSWRSRLQTVKHEWTSLQ